MGRWTTDTATPHVFLKIQIDEFSNISQREGGVGCIYTSFTSLKLRKGVSFPPIFPGSLQCLELPPKTFVWFFGTHSLIIQIPPPNPLFSWVLYPHTLSIPTLNPYKDMSTYSSPSPLLLSPPHPMSSITELQEGPGVLPVLELGRILPITSWVHSRRKMGEDVVPMLWYYFQSMSGRDVMCWCDIYVML